MTETTSRLRDLSDAGVYVYVATSTTVRGERTSYRVYADDGACLEAGALTPAEVDEVRAFVVRAA